MNTPPHGSPRLLTFGYAGQSVDELIRWAKREHALILDVRYAPRSRNPLWRGSHLQSRLGELYAHAKGLGNLNYRGGPIKLAAFEHHYVRIRELVESEGRTVVLMCVCRDPRICHRTLIAKEMRRRGLTVRELNLRGELDDEQSLWARERGPP